MTTYRIGSLLEVSYEGPPPCLWCAQPVLPPGSMDGPLVCGLCDSGLIQDADGTVRKWTPEEYSRLKAHRSKVIEEIRALNEHQRGNVEQ